MFCQFLVEISMFASMYLKVFLLLCLYVSTIKKTFLESPLSNHIDVFVVV